MPRRPALAIAILLLPAIPATAQDEPIELADDPFEITDPIAAPTGQAEIGFVGSYERARRGRVRDTGGIETELEVGVAPGLEFRVGQVGAYGNLETRRRLGTIGPEQEGGTEGGERARWGGTSRVGALYQFTDGRGLMPAVGLLGRLRTLYGPSQPTHEAEAVLLVGKTVLRGERPLGIHLNLGWVARLDPQPGDRPSRYLFNASVGQAVSRNTALVLTYAREQQERGERDFSLLQAGLRHRLAGLPAVIGLAAGLGLSRDSPRFQLAFAVQWELGAW